MCGLIVAPRHYAGKIPAALHRMAYRGPDSSGITYSDRWVMGHTRLAIQNLKEGHQPIRTNTGSVSFVGEFFNRPRRCSEQAYVRDLANTGNWESLMGIDGFWSIAHITDQRAEVVTDHLAIKPLYVWEEKGIICSELEAMFMLAPRPAFDSFYLDFITQTGYPPSVSATPYRGIKAIPPGTVLTVMGNGVNAPTIESRRYWDWGRVPRHGSIRKVVTEAIANRVTHSDVPVSMLLSGGLDSSIIYYTLKELGHLVKPFAIENGESEFLPKDQNLQFLKATYPTLETAVKIMQTPQDLGSLLPQVHLARAVNDAGYRVCLTGDGADELFGGYTRATLWDSQTFDTMFELPVWHLPRLDRVHMYYSTELRSPFLAPAVVASALAVPRFQRTTKQVLKSAFQGTVPDKILERPKKPLKSQPLLDNPVAHRAALVRSFCNVFAS
jgi:asparagine synthase (glutamine-hydrolysing)